VQFTEPHVVWPYKKPQHTYARASKSFARMPMANILAKIFAELCDLPTVRQGKSFPPPLERGRGWHPCVRGAGAWPCVCAAVEFAIIAA